MQDYRDVNNKYNSIASIEMIEAVGQNYLKSFFNKIKQNLEPNGSAAIQAITIDDSPVSYTHLTLPTNREV